MEALELKKKAAVLRKNLIELIYKGGTGHTGGDLSVLNVLTTLYYHTMNVDAKNPKMENRDRFILSKGHCAEALYTILCDKGFIEQSELDAYGTFHAHLGGHPDNSIPGVEINTGALGHGLSVGVGMSLAGKLDKKDYHVYVVMGDGEQAEGSIYEAAMAANKYKLDNLVAFIDRNGLQISGSTEDVMPLESIEERWTAFGWDVKTIHGDNIEEVKAALDAVDYSNGKPHLFISRSTKGLGVSFMENVAKWHHGVPTKEQYEEAMKELDEQINAL
ncbi:MULTISPECIES: transketolase [Segatella]|jgi:transketolase|uniref:Transketolase n=2 Tax=Segatella TaxID=2974251 RepID=D8DVY3_9BACT|nr:MULTISPECIES: transketolase [Segatella]EFI72428.1 transketolase [Segatella baroniae B14]MDR4931534.1 transketolase [Segatella bryantii]OYP55341.1 transketolase [Segatella bryantii]UKK79431.1 transketolase [Segatella baroniae B14]UKK81967.1 transketolase [Segatella bryantii]